MASDDQLQEEDARLVNSGLVEPDELSLDAAGEWFTARKAHTCRWCGNLIPSGSRYFRSGKQAFHRPCAVSKFGTVSENS